LACRYRYRNHCVSSKQNILKQRKKKRKFKLRM
jgi:hypothetical protein